VFGQLAHYLREAQNTSRDVSGRLGDSVTELNATTGTLPRVLSGSHDGFSQPEAISSDGTDVWVANPGNESVTGFPA